MLQTVFQFHTAYFVSKDFNCAISCYSISTSRHVSYDGTSCYYSTSQVVILIVIPHHITLTNTYFTLYLCTALHYKYIYHLSFQSDMDMILGKTDIEKRDEVKVYSPDFLIITALTSTTAKLCKIAQNDDFQASKNAC